MRKSLDEQFTTMSRLHNATIQKVKTLRKIIKNDETGEDEKKEKEKQLIFWETMHQQQMEVISKIVHEAIRLKENIEIRNEDELYALIFFFAANGVEGHKIVSISPNFPETRFSMNFVQAYCSENRYLMKGLIISIMTE